MCQNHTHGCYLKAVNSSTRQSRHEYTLQLTNKANDYLHIFLRLYFACEAQVSCGEIMVVIYSTLQKAVVSVYGQ